MQLSATSILALCSPVSDDMDKWLRVPLRGGTDGPCPMISPFVPEKRIQNGKSYGLSVASYDLRIAHDLHLSRGQFAIAHTIEDFAIPLNVSGQICDKSTYARMGVSCFNTFFDPGFIGNGTLELVNLGPDDVFISAGDPICQMVFQWVDQVTVGYAGKYQHQPKEAVPARLEGQGVT